MNDQFNNRLKTNVLKNIMVKWLH